MAILEQPPASGGSLTGWDLPDSLPPAGTFLAVCCGVKDTFDVERPTFDDPSVIEKVNLTRFAFGFTAQDGINYIVTTREFKISAHEKANLFQFLMQWLGHPPTIGWDYMEMTGRGAQITVGHETSRRTGRVFPAITTIAPVLDALKPQVPDASLYPLPAGDGPADPQPAPTPAPAPQGQALPEQPAPAAPAPAVPQPAPAPAAPPVQQPQAPAPAQPAQPQAPAATTTEAGGQDVWAAVKAEGKKENDVPF